jgi:hypothetical protein
LDNPSAEHRKNSFWRIFAGTHFFTFVLEALYKRRTRIKKHYIIGPEVHWKKREKNISLY